MEGMGLVHPTRYGRDRRRHLAALLLIGGLAILTLAQAPSAGAVPRAFIFDWLATPSWTSLADPITGAGSSQDQAWDVSLAKGDVVFVAGYRSNVAGNADITLVKYKGSVKLWTTDYNGPGNGDDEGQALALSPDGKFVYATGFSTSATGSIDLIVVKRSSQTGALKWARRYDGAAHAGDAGRHVGVDAEGNVIVAGDSMNDADIDWVVASWTASGDRRWVWRYRGAGTSADMTQGLVVAPDDTVYVGGYSMSATTGTAVTARISSQGAKIWLKRYLGPAHLGAEVFGLAPRPGGGVYAAGTARTTATNTDGMVLRYSPAGKRTDFVYDTAGGGATSEAFMDVAVASTKDVIVAGLTDTGTDMDSRVTAYHRDGSIFGAITVPGAWDDRFYGVATDKLGGYYVTGIQHVAAADCKIFTARGSVLTGGGGWYSQWGPAASVNNFPKAIAVRGTTACVVGGYDSGGPTGVDQAVLTYVY